MWTLLKAVGRPLSRWRADRAEAKRVAEQRKLVGRVVRARTDGCSCGQDRSIVAELWRLTDIVVDDTDYHAVPFGKEKEWGRNYEYLCPNGFVLVDEPSTKGE